MLKPVNVKLIRPPQSSFKYKKVQLKLLEFNWHCHPEYEIMYMNCSRGKRFIGDSFSFYSPGALFFIGPNLPHAWYAPQKSRGDKLLHEAVLVQFPGTCTGIDFYKVAEFSAITHLFSLARRGVQFHGELCNTVGKKLLMMNEQDSIGRLVSLISILDDLSKATMREREILSSSELSGSFNPGEQKRIDRVCTYINENYMNPLKLENVANIVNMSTTAFCRFFKRSTGKTFVNYVNELRIGWACKLLIESELTIAEICYKVGFNNLSNFNRRFHERHRISPRGYRREFEFQF